jgi:hypothetical protein
VLVTFDNYSYADVNLYWCDYNGDKMLNNTIHGRGVLQVSTYEGHPWIIEDSNGNAFNINGEPVYVASEFDGGAFALVDYGPGISVRSISSDTEISITISNLIDEEVELKWYDFSGNQVDYGSI